MSERTIVVYGHPATRVNRPLWLLRELDVPYKVDTSIHFHSDEFPGANKKQPALLDMDGTVMFESLAINLYLIRKYGDNHILAPANSVEQAGTYQWTMFAMTEFDPRLFELLFHSPLVEKAGHPLANDASYANYFGRQRSERRRNRIQKELEAPLAVLEKALSSSTSPYLLGDRFTLADLNVAVVLEWARLPLGLELASSTQSWLERCMTRPKSPRMLKERDVPTLGTMLNKDSFAKRYGTIGFIDSPDKSRL